MMIAILVMISVAFVQSNAFKCEVKLEAVGCFKDSRSDRAMPHELINERDIFSKVHNGKLIEWNNPNYVPGFICRCARKAKHYGYMYFGIQFYGECWSGRKSHLFYNRHGRSSNCKKNSNSKSTCHMEYGKQNANYVYKIVDRQCETKFSPVGCFSDTMISPRPMPNYAMNERDRSIDNWNGFMIDWQNWNTYLPQLVCRCAQVARDFGHDLFAIQFYGECWTGKRGASNYHRDGGSNKCVGANFTTCKCYEYHCAGMQKTNFVYRLNGAVVGDEQAIQDYHHYDYPEYKDNAYYYNTGV